MLSVAPDTFQEEPGQKPRIPSSYAIRSCIDASHHMCEMFAMIATRMPTPPLFRYAYPIDAPHILQVRNSGMPILVYANKGDLPGSLTPQDCADELGLTRLNKEQTPWHIE